MVMTGTLFRTRFVLTVAMRLARGASPGRQYRPRLSKAFWSFLIQSKAVVADVGRAPRPSDTERRYAHKLKLRTGGTGKFNQAGTGKRLRQA